MSASIWSPNTLQVPIVPAIAPVQFVVGSAAAPGITFVGFTGSGFYSEAAGSVDVAISGVQQAKFTADGIRLYSGKFIQAPELTVASAATCDIGSVDSNSVLITGTSNITSFGTTYRGPMFVRFNGTLIITNSASLVLPNGLSSVTVNDGDQMIVVPKATAGVSDSWVVSSFTRMKGIIRQYNVTDGIDGIFSYNAAGALIGQMYGFGTSYFTFQAAPNINNIIATSGTGVIRFDTAVPNAFNIDATGNFVAKATGSLGYGANSGGVVVQGVSKATGVALNKSSGQITVNAANLAAGTTVGFVLTNTQIAADDVLIVNIKSGATAGAYRTQVEAISAGSARITLRNETAGALAEAIVLQYVLIKGAIA